jgi:hypothetical protein
MIAHHTASLLGLAAAKGIVGAHVAASGGSEES